MRSTSLEFGCRQLPLLSPCFSLSKVVSKADRVPAMGANTPGNYHAAIAHRLTEARRRIQMLRCSKPKLAQNLKERLLLGHGELGRNDRNGRKADFMDRISGPQRFLLHFKRYRRFGIITMHSESNSPQFGVKPRRSTFPNITNFQLLDQPAGITGYAIPHLER